MSYFLVPVTNLIMEQNLIFKDTIIIPIYQIKQVEECQKAYSEIYSIITTNQTFSKWGELFNDNVLANAILDRLLHHSYVFNIAGESYRIKDMMSKLENINNTKSMVSKLVKIIFPFLVILVLTFITFRG